MSLNFQVQTFKSCRKLVFHSVTFAIKFTVVHSVLQTIVTQSLSLVCNVQSSVISMILSGLKPSHTIQNLVFECLGTR